MTFSCQIFSKKKNFNCFTCRVVQILLVFLNITVVQTNSSAKNIDDTIIHYGNTKVKFEGMIYKQKFKDLSDKLKSDVDEYDWEYIYHVKNIAEKMLEEAGLPKILSAGLFFEITHFKTVNIEKTLPHLGESSSKVFEKTTNKKKKEDIDYQLLEHFGYTHSKLKHIMPTQHPYLVLNRFILKLKTVYGRISIGNDVKRLNLFFYTFQQIKDSIKSNAQAFEGFQIDTKNTSQHEFVVRSLQIAEPIKAIIIWGFMKNYLKDFKPKFQFKPYTCKKGDTWASIIKEEKLDSITFHKYNNFFIKKNPKLIKGDLLILPIALETNNVENTIKIKQDAVKNSPEKMGNVENKNKGFENENDNFAKENERLRKENKDLTKKNEDLKEKINIVPKPKDKQENDNKNASIRRPDQQTPDKYLRYSLEKIKNQKPQPLIHIVLKGETLWRISVKYGIKVEELKKINNLKSNLILSGQKIIVARENQLRGISYRTTVLLGDLNAHKLLILKSLMRNPKNEIIMKKIRLKEQLTAPKSNKYIKNYKTPKK